MKSEIDAQKENLATTAKNLETAMNTGNDKIKEIIQRENEKRQKDMMVIITILIMMLGTMAFLLF